MLSSFLLYLFLISNKGEMIATEDKQEKVEVRFYSK